MNIYASSKRDDELYKCVCTQECVIACSVLLEVFLFQKGCLTLLHYITISKPYYYAFKFNNAFAEIIDPSS